MPPTSRRLARRTVVPWLAAMLLAGCTGAGGTTPSESPSAVSSTADVESPTTTPSTVPASPTAIPEPTSTPTAGIEPPTEAPSEFGEFVIPAPDQLTEQYAAWVLAQIYRAEDELIRRSVEAPDEKLDDLPDDLATSLRQVYGGEVLRVGRATALRTIELTPEDDAFQDPVGSTRLTSIQLLDATQECLILRFTDDSTDVISTAGEPEDMIVQLGPKPEIDGSSLNRTPWLMVNRAPVADVTGSECAS